MEGEGGDGKAMDDIRLHRPVVAWAVGASPVIAGVAGDGEASPDLRD